MKLVSFAVISLLAITVNAQILSSASDAKYALQSDQNTIEDKIQELEAYYKTKKEAVFNIVELEELEQKERETKSVMKDIEEELKNDSLTKDRKSDLMRQSNCALDNWKNARRVLTAKQEKLTQAMEQRSYVEMKLSILEENIEQQPDPDPNDESQDPMGASYNSNLPRKILAEQIGEFCQDAVDLFAAYDDIKVGIDRFGDVIDITKNPKRRFELIQTRNKSVRPYNKLVNEVKLAQCKCTYAKEFQTEFGWMPQSLRANKVFKSSRKGHKMN
ncbi:hypothetical protein BASA50_000598 [Batrachochytrium salamandrivorans]|uniref:Uncharacterized protein n=1 Tax=Batrachochytrium salamandrivorans TaxID=1357716 RepID=A0ABQ8ET10_9FUNG|nr:hypothetical protein BASA50_000598 [Batrachochytrium salamandrivorans]